MYIIHIYMYMYNYVHVHVRVTVCTCTCLLCQRIYLRSCSMTKTITSLVLSQS